MSGPRKPMTDETPARSGLSTKSSPATLDGLAAGGAGVSGDDGVLTVRQAISPGGGGLLVPLSQGEGRPPRYRISRVLNTLTPDGGPVVFSPGESAPDWLVAVAKAGVLVDTDRAAVTTD